MQKCQMWIDGKWVDASSGKTYPIVNPATEEEIADIPLGDEQDVNKAVAAAEKAFPIWSAKSLEERIQTVLSIAATMREYAPELAKLDTLEHGTPAKMAMGMMMGSPNSLEWAAHASRALFGEYIPTARTDRFYYLKREPIGVCALIIPWNGPLGMLISKIGPTLVLGNTCVVKPPSINNLTILKFAEILEKHNLPPGTVNIVTGPGSTVGEAMASHPCVGLVSFTGSCETGKRIMEVGSQTVKRLILELGGKNPFIVLEDANLDIAANHAAMCTQANSGMVCASPGRYYIHEKLYDEFVDKYIAGAKNWIVGDPNDDKTMMGPVVSAEHRDKVEGLIKKGIEEGAKLVLGGERPTQPPLNKGYYVVPTAFTDVTQEMTIAREEIFGPVACFIKFFDEDKVIEMANNSTFGLAASVWTKDKAKAIRFANAINAGTIWINDHMGKGDELPFGGFKQSGFGKVDHIIGLEEYTQVKQISFDLIEGQC